MIAIPFLILGLGLLVLPFLVLRETAGSPEGFLIGLVIVIPCWGLLGMAIHAIGRF